MARAGKQRQKPAAASGLSRMFRGLPVQRANPPANASPSTPTVPSTSCPAALITRQRFGAWMMVHPCETGEQAGNPGTAPPRVAATGFQPKFQGTAGRLPKVRRSLQGDRVTGVKADQVRNMPVRRFAFLKVFVPLLQLSFFADFQRREYEIGLVECGHFFEERVGAFPQKVGVQTELIMPASWPAVHPLPNWLPTGSGRG